MFLTRLGGSGPGATPWEPVGSPPAPARPATTPAKPASGAGVPAEVLVQPLPELSPLTSADSDTPVEQNRVTEGMNEKFKPADSFHA